MPGSFRAFTESTDHILGVEEKHACGTSLAGSDEDGLCPPQGGAPSAGVNIYGHHFGISLWIGTKSYLFFECCISKAGLPKSREQANPVGFAPWAILVWFRPHPAQVEHSFHIPDLSSVSTHAAVVFWAKIVNAYFSVSA